jgi:UDP-N-acetylenolpyruvoylglucosamine reductase
MGKLKAASHQLSVDAAEYSWEYRHAWFVQREKSLRAISVRVTLDPGRNRELILDLSFQVPGLERNPSDAKVAAAVRDGIRGALEAGWDPESRGRAFRYELDGTD